MIKLLHRAIIINKKQKTATFKCRTLFSSFRETFFFFTYTILLYTQRPIFIFRFTTNADKNYAHIIHYYIFEPLDGFSVHLYQCSFFIYLLSVHLLYSLLYLIFTQNVHIIFSNMKIQYLIQGIKILKRNAIDILNFYKDIF